VFIQLVHGRYVPFNIGCLLFFTFSIVKQQTANGSHLLAMKSTMEAAWHMLNLSKI